MADDATVEFVRVVAKYGCFLLAGKISADEFRWAILDELAAAPEANAALAAEVVAALPVGARPALTAVVQAGLAPGFRKGAWFRGGGVPQTDAQREAESALLTARVRAWVVLLTECLGTQANEPGAVSHPIT